MAPTSIECDLLLFYATTSEREQLEAVAKEPRLPFRRQQHDHLGRYYALGRIGDFEVIAVRTEMGPLAYDGAASKGIFFKLGTPATAIVQLGMAFGIDPGLQRPGDVLVSSSLIPYDRRRAEAHSDHYRFDYTDAKPHPARRSMLELFLKESQRSGMPFRVHVGAVLSGATAIYSTKYRDELVNTFRPLVSEPIVGGDMEAVGLLSVSPPDDLAWIMVKGISDFADDKRPEGWEVTRNLACHNSAWFVLTSLLNAKVP